MRQRAILPSKHITQAIAEAMVELDIAEVDYHSLISIVVDAATVTEPNNFYEPYDSISNALLGMKDEYDELTMAKVSIDEVPGLSDELARLAVKLNREMIAIGLGEVHNPDPDRILPYMFVVETTVPGDIIVEFEN